MALRSSLSLVLEAPAKTAVRKRAGEQKKFVVSARHFSSTLMNPMLFHLTGALLWRGCREMIGGITLRTTFFSRAHLASGPRNGTSQSDSPPGIPAATTAPGLALLHPASGRALTTTSTRTLFRSSRMCGACTWFLPRTRRLALNRWGLCWARVSFVELLTYLNEYVYIYIHMYIFIYVRV